MYQVGLDSKCKRSWMAISKTKLEEDFHYTRSNVVCYRFSPSPKRELEILQTLTNNTIQTKDCAPGFIRPWPYITIYVFFLPCVGVFWSWSWNNNEIHYICIYCTLFNIRLVGKKLNPLFTCIDKKKYFIVWLRFHFKKTDCRYQRPEKDLWGSGKGFS